MSKLEDHLELQLRQAKLVAGMQREYAFHPERKWRFDFAWPYYRLYVEVDGGSMTQAHHTYQGRRKDHEKRNAATLMGWRGLVGEKTTIHNRVLVELVEQYLATPPRNPT
jgi:very-short-patch-repair endonuclease